MIALVISALAPNEPRMMTAESTQTPMDVRRLMRRRYLTAAGTGPTGFEGAIETLGWGTPPTTGGGGAAGAGAGAPPESQVGAFEGAGMGAGVGTGGGAPAGAGAGAGAAENGLSSWLAQDILCADERGKRERER